MNPLRLIVVPLIIVTVTLLISSIYLRRNSQLSSINTNESTFDLEIVAQSTLNKVSKVYLLANSGLAKVSGVINKYQKFFSIGVSKFRRLLVEVDSINFSNLYYLKPESLIRIGKFDTAPNVFSIPIEERIDFIRQHPWIEDVSLDFKIFPIRLEISVTEAEPWVVAEYAGHSWLLSRKRKLLSPLAVLPNSDLIEISSNKGRIDGLADTPGVDNYLSSENARLDYASKMVEILELAKVFSFEVDRYTLKNDGSLTISAKPPSEFPNVRINVHSLAEAQIVAKQLNSVVEDLRIRGEKAREIDLRFQPQVIVR